MKYFVKEKNSYLFPIGFFLKSKLDKLSESKFKIIIHYKK